MQIRSLETGRGWGWITEGFDLFRRSALLWIVIALLYTVVTSAISMIPLLGTAALTIIQPVLGAGFMVACRELANGRELRIDQLFEGFRNKTQPLLTVGLLTFAGYVAIMMLVGGAFMLFGGVEAASGVFTGNYPEPHTREEAMPLALGVLASVLVGLALAVPLAMASWFAPALVWFDNLPAFDAMKQSLQGCWKNVLPFMLYGLILGVLLIVAVLPFGLGLLVLIPAAVCSVYVSYLDIFADTP